MKKTEQISNDSKVLQIVNDITSGNITSLSKAITLVESTLPEHKKIANEIIEKCLKFSGNSYRIGISGVPGVGKSTFIEAFGLKLIEQGKKVAVLAIDPSSEFSKGSILGDKTRMNELSCNKNAFIRPSPSSGLLGGVGRHTRQSIILCEAAGFDTILIETVGVGQSETVANSMVDMFILLMLAGAGDELQGIKRGIMEIADIIAINKADGNNLKKAELAALDYKNALNLFPQTKPMWKPCVTTCSAITKNGLDELIELTSEYYSKSVGNGYFSQNRTEQTKKWLFEIIEEEILQKFYNKKGLFNKIKKLENQVIKGDITALKAAQIIIKNDK